jgi:YfiH family protein
MAIPLIQAPGLASLPGIAHGFSTRQGGVSGGIYAALNCGVGSADDPGRVQTNRARLADSFSLAPDRLSTVHQVHGNRAVVVEAPFPAHDRPKADAQVTRVPGIALGVGIADCGPVLFADPGAGVVGAAHSGWQGAFSGVLDATVEAMEGLGARRGRIQAVLGPAISVRSYEVGPEFQARFAVADAANERFFRPSARPGHFFFDLPGYILSRLGRLGLGGAVDLGLCTYEDEDRFFSYRRATHRGEPDYGRMLGIIALST